MSSEISDSISRQSDEQYLKTKLRAALNISDETGMWLDGLIFKFDHQVLTVRFIHPLFGNWFKINKQKVFEELLGIHYNKKDFRLLYDWSHVPEIKTRAPKNLVNMPAAREKEKDHFEEFVTNEKNSFALNLLKMSASEDGLRIGNKNRTEFLFVLCGPSGTGKTHLLKAVHASLGKFLNPVFADAHSFCALHSLASLGDNFFIRRHRGLILDNLRDIAQNSAWQFFLARCIDRILESQPGKERHAPGRIFFAFTGHADELAELDLHLRTRLEKGIIIELREADLEVRLRYLENACRKMGLPLERDQILFMGRQYTRIPMLAGCLQKIEIFKSLHNRIPSKHELENINSSDTAKTPSWQDILAAVSRKLRLKPEEVLGQSRKPELVLARQITMYLCRLKLGLSYPDLGRFLGGRDHSTVIHSIKKIRDLAQTDKDMHNLLKELENMRV